MHLSARAIDGYCSDACASPGVTRHTTRFDGARLWLVCEVSGKAYGIDMRRVQEVRGYEQPSRIEKVPRIVSGAVNLRGKLMLIADLRLRLGVQAPAADASTAVVVVAVGDRLVGCVVDGVSEVVELHEGESTASWQTRLEAGGRAPVVAGANGMTQVLTLLDLEREMADVFSVECI